MDRYQKTKEAILNLNEKTTDSIRQIENALGKSISSFEQWRESSANIQQNLIDHVMRIAVVGAIKSGKSTLVNTLLQDDYLKRGAGVVTSIVTRIRRGESLTARLYLKSWDEINDDIEQALVLFPSEDWQAGEKQFDIRRSKDRTDLASALDTLNSDLKIAKDSLNANSVLLSSYLKGYDQLESFIEADSSIREFGADDFGSHRNFVGDDALAVYLKDIQLNVTSDSLETNLEIADCQGSDSPNPLHMAMIQDYLLQAHLIVYVISSRTGLRQADIHFLSIIKQMGISDNMIFVCNSDFNEHESHEDLEVLVAKIKEELSIVAFEPQIFVFSALYHLFEFQKSKISLREKDRLEQWAELIDLAEASSKEFKRLESELERKLTVERSALLLQNQLERLNVVQNGMLNWVQLNRNLLKRDADDAESLAQRIEGHQDYMVQVQTIIRGTLDGSVKSIVSELKREIDRFFDRHSGQIFQDIISFIRNHRVNLDKYKIEAINIGFNQSLYLVFQDFKQAVDKYMAEHTNPEIVGFVGRLETQLNDYFQSVIEPFGAMVQDALHQYEEALSHFDFSELHCPWSSDSIPDISSIKQSISLELPPAIATMRYSAHIKTDAIVRFGLFNLLRVARKVFKKQNREKGEEELQALKAGVRRMKRETERSIHAHFMDYRENIKFQYVLKLVDASVSRLYESLTGHFKIYLSDLKELLSLMGDESSGKMQLDKAFEQIEKDLQSSRGDTDSLRQDIELMRGGPDAASQK